MPTVTIDSTEFTVYADVGEADEYALGAIHATTWRDSTTTNTTKAMALVTATRLLDRQSWVDDYDTVAERQASEDIVNASIELAFALVDGSPVQNDQSIAQTIQQLKAGSVGITYFRGAEGSPNRFPQIVHELLVGKLKAGSDFIAGALSYGTDGESVTGNDFDFNDAF